MEEVYKCEECGHVGRSLEFGVRGNRRCPKCSSEQVFPHRFFKCKACGYIAHQDDWFPEYPLDENPLEEGVESEACLTCIDRAQWDEDDEDDSKPTDLELVPVDTLKEVPEEARVLVGEVLSSDALFLWWFKSENTYRKWIPRDEWQDDKSAVIDFINRAKNGERGYKF